jgi:Methionine synthase I, cobalamin-binding domain
MLNIIIGEKLNSSIKSTFEAMVNFDTDFIINSVKNQANAGADYIDVNTAMCGDEYNLMIKIVDLILEHTDCGISIDSADADVITKTAGYIYSKNRKFILNSVTLTERIDELIPVAVKYDCKIIAMLITAYGIKAEPDSRIANADTVIKRFIDSGIKPENIIIDMVVESLLGNYESSAVTCETLKRFKAKYPDITTLCGISNISYGLPNRAVLNAAFLSAVIHNGLDCAIYDVNAPENQAAVYLANLLRGDDEYCIDYINWTRE